MATSTLIVCAGRKHYTHAGKSSLILQQGLSANSLKLQLWRVNSQGSWMDTIGAVSISRSVNRKMKNDISKYFLFVLVFIFPYASFIPHLSMLNIFSFLV